MLLRNRVIVLLGVFLIFGGCSLKVSDAPKKSSASDNNDAKIGNLASTFCKDQGGLNKIVVNKDGSESGLCVFEDGSSCDEWAFYRNECTKGDSLVRYNWKY